MGNLLDRLVQARHLSRWLLPCLLRKRGSPRNGQPVHLLLCIADHFEPMMCGAARTQALERARRWEEEYPRLFGHFRDSDGQPPRHTFFFPAEEYDPEHVDSLARLCSRGYGEVEVHLHHDNDTEDNLRKTLLGFRDTLANEHGLLGRRRDTGSPTYGFIHGNWALCNSRPDGRWCGVHNELTILRETGCYADFTLPSAPSPTQTTKVNSIYYARDIPGARRSHDRGVDVGAGPAPEDALLLIQGPLLLDWKRRKYGLLPRLENGCLHGNHPPTAHRLDLWLAARVQAPSRPDWYFVKLHAHGAPEKNAGMLLGEPMIRFHEALARRAREDASFHFHYVTAREMYNLARAAEAGWTGAVGEARSFEILAAEALLEARASGQRSTLARS